MPDPLSLLILGLVQGLTEFLPVSSTGHLIIAREVFGFSTEHGLAVDATLHLATALAVLVYFRKDIWNLIVSFFNFILRRSVSETDRTLILGLILGTIPAVIIGFLLQNTIETTFRSSHIVAYGLILGSLLFFVAERVAKQTKELSVGKGIIVGLFQALALIPGMSRSGSTISGGLLLGLTREQATRFAFLLSFPIILGAGSLKFLELGASGFLAADAFPIMIGALAAFLSGLAAIHFMITFLKKNTLDIFIVYRVALAVVILFFF